jgi:CheY-like chemotaxis protein
VSAKKAILFVDDESIILMALRQELRNELGSDYRYEIALNALEGLEIFNELASDGVRVVLLISDWLMPGMKGDEFLIIARERYPSVRTILVSGQTDENQLDKLRDSGALDAFIHKPWASGRLLAECKRLLSDC